MARQVDSAVLIVSALAAFFATFFAVLLLLQPDRYLPAAGEIVETSAEPLPPVAAAPPIENLPAAPGARRSGPALEVLGQLGVRCAEGVDCEQSDR